MTFELSFYVLVRYLTQNLFLFLLVAALLSACAGKPLLYQWGSYNAQIYAMYHDPGKVPVEKQLEDTRTGLPAGQSSR